jgi:hypothetical protein
MDMIFIPLAEVLDCPSDEMIGDIERSLTRIFQKLRDDADPRDGEGQIRLSFSVIRAFAKEFCNIPPFGDSRERTEGIAS